MTHERRPHPSEVADEATLQRWYWLRSELQDLARRLGLSPGGSKAELTERIAAHLGGRQAPPAPRRPATRDLLPDTLTGATAIALGQRCTQHLRAWMREHVGSSFTFDAPMRAAVAAGGITLDELVGRWHETRDRAPSDIAPQFELNRFARSWHAEHPGATHAQMLEAWAEHRATPRVPPSSPVG